MLIISSTVLLRKFLIQTQNNAVILRKKKVVLHIDNATPHRANSIQNFARKN